MSEQIYTYMKRLCDEYQVSISAGQASLFRQFATDETRMSAYALISKTKDQIVKDWKEQSAIMAIIEKPVQIANARVGVDVVRSGLRRMLRREARVTGPDMCIICQLPKL